MLPLSASATAVTGVNERVAIPHGQAIGPVDRHAFLGGFVAAGIAGEQLGSLGRVEGFSVPGLRPEHPHNRALFALQEEVRGTIGGDRMALAPYVTRYIALMRAISQVDTDAELQRYIGCNDHRCYNEYRPCLIYAAATTPLHRAPSPDHGYIFDRAELLTEAALWDTAPN